LIVSIVLTWIEWEIIFVDDDSPDGTAAFIRDIARTDGRVRRIRRIGRRGLSTACIEGILASCAPYAAVMDADLHDERILPEMLDLLRRQSCDVVVGSRYIAGGGGGDWDSKRVKISVFANRLSRVLCRVEIADAMSGFFMLRRPAFDAAAVGRMSGHGFKILLDLLASSPYPLKIREVPYKFGMRRFGESKLYPGCLAVPPADGRQANWPCCTGAVCDFRTHRRAWRRRPSGRSLVLLQVHRAEFRLRADRGHDLCDDVDFLPEQPVYLSRPPHSGLAYIASLGVLLLYLRSRRDRQHRNWLVRLRYDQTWWLAGLAGVSIGAVWNYAVSSVFVWKR
jgi:dolichol-phosphate mannosyltransferase